MKKTEEEGDSTYHTYDEHQYWDCSYEMELDYGFGEGEFIVFRNGRYIPRQETGADHYE